MLVQIKILYFYNYFIYNIFDKKNDVYLFERWFLDVFF